MNDIQEKIDAVFENMPNVPRAHIGPSQAGEPCDRRLWLGFRWAVEKTFPGRMLRLFKRGQDEEARIVSTLQAIGYDVREYGDDQRRVLFGGHVSGSVDGIIISPISAILEVKTHNVKSFDALEKSGVRASKPEHYIQMQCYMKATDLTKALYVAVCKDDDRIYNETIEYNADDADRAVKRLRRISETEHIPEPISTDATWYQCRFCEAHEFCHGSHITRNVNCRTCAHSTPMLSGEWHCMRWKSKVPTDAQRDGCDAHTPHPDLVPWRLNREKSTELAGFYDGIGLVGEGGRLSKECLH